MDVSDRSVFRFLDLPDELRLKLYRFILPRGERIHLDPEEVQFPIPYIVEESYGTTFNLLQVCKKIHVEATQFIYEHNTVNIIETSQKGDFLDDLGATACEYISKLECHVTEGLADLGSIWNTMAACPRLSDVRLVFYHEAKNWSKTLAQIALYIQCKHEDDSEGEEDVINLDVELHNSIWAYRYSTQDYAQQFQKSLEQAERHAQVYSFDIPNQLRHITIAVSAAPNGSASLISWDDCDELWEFQRAGKNNTEIKKTLRFARIAEKSWDDYYS